MVPQEVDRGNQGESVYIPSSNINKSSRLTSVDKKNEWVDNIMSLGARTIFEMYKEVELCSRLDYSIYEVKKFLRLL